MSKVYKLHRVQLLRTTMDEAWRFFSNPNNLQAITPPFMKFKITNTYGDEMYAGQLIEYRVRPLLGIPLYWMTEITHIKDKEYFVDEQRFGPYKFWHHQHHFKEVEHGVEMTDLLHYKIPYYFLGDVANRLLVQKKVAQIFDYREKKIKEMYG
jgi:ligand-binding SRPBCC domain-containing protein